MWCGDVIRVILNWVKFIKAKPAYDKLREFSFKDVGVFTRQAGYNKNMLSLCIMGIVGASVVGAFPIHRAKSQGIWASFSSIFDLSFFFITSLASLPTSWKCNNKSVEHPFKKKTCNTNLALLVCQVETLRFRSPATTGAPHTVRSGLV